MTSSLKTTYNSMIIFAYLYYSENLARKLSRITPEGQIRYKSVWLPSCQAERLQQILFFNNISFIWRYIKTKRMMKSRCVMICKILMVVKVRWQMGFSIMLTLLFNVWLSSLTNKEAISGIYYKCVCSLSLPLNFSEGKAKDLIFLNK